MLGTKYECSCVVLNETLDDFGPRSKPTSLARVEKIGAKSYQRILVIKMDWI
jgi:hypothetical protein